MTKTAKRLTRGNPRKLFGVCAGVADYLEVDPVVVRVVWIIASALTGGFPGVVAYILAALVMPEKV